MENTLLINDRIIVNELEPKLIPIEHGDVVVFTDPGGWMHDLPVTAPPTVIDSVLGFVGLTAPDSNDHLTKRVIGLPGDTVACCNDFGQMTDSRFHRDLPSHGFVPFGDVVGRAVLITWPVDRWTPLGNSPLVFAKVEDEVATRSQAST
jgi:signal peptidase I